MFAYAKMASLGCLALAAVLLAGCNSKPNVEEAQKAISRFDAMQPQEVLCNPTELANFRHAVKRYAKAKQADGVMWPDFTYENARPDDLTITVLAAEYVRLMPSGDIGKAAWRLDELNPHWTSIYGYPDGDEPLSKPNATLLRNGAKYACEDLIEYGRALAEFQLGEAYWRERIVNETVLSNRPAEQKGKLLARASKRTASDWRQVLRLQRDLVRAVDSAQLAQR